MNDVELLLNRLCHLVVAFERALARRPDHSNGRSLDLPGLAVLVSLDLYGPLRPTSIATLLGGTSAMATKVIGRLERAGDVTRLLGTVPEDRRAVVVHLTDDGRETIQRCEHVLTELGTDLLASIAAVDLAASRDQGEGTRTVSVPGQQPLTTGPGLAEFLRFVVEVDKPLLDTVGEIEPLHPADPRGLLILSEIHLRGPIRSGAVAPLIDRSRGAANGLVRRLVAAGVVACRTGDVPGDRRAVTIELTPVGRAIIRGVISAVTARLPDLRPTMISLSRVLAGQHQGLGAAPR